MSATQERSYLDELLEDENYNLTFHIEEALVEAAEKIKDAMADANINRTKIAQKLKISLPQVSRALNGSHNLTVRTLASMLWASGKKLTIDYTDIQEEEEQQGFKGQMVVYPVQFIRTVKAAEQSQKRSFRVHADSSSPIPKKLNISKGAA